MMKRFIQLFFILNVLWVQFGSTGLTFFVNSCSVSGNVWTSTTRIQCMCDNDDLSLEKHNNWQDTFEKDCCRSSEHFVSTAEDFPSNLVDSHAPISTEIEWQEYDLGIQEFEEPQKVKSFDVDSPPWKRRNTQEFNQSYLI